MTILQKLLGNPGRFLKWLHGTRVIQLITYRCIMCEDHELPHTGFAAVLSWDRDRSMFRSMSSRNIFGLMFRRRHPRWSRFLCMFNKHESWLLDEPMTCTRCGKEYKFKC